MCKLKGKEPCKCYWMDDLPELIDKIFHAKSVFFGTPNYLGRPTSQFLGLLERLHFCSLSYDDYSNHFKGKVSVGLFITMNANEEMYNKLYKNAFEEYIYGLRHLNGEVIVSPCFDTLQVGDYSRYNMSSFNEKMKIESNKNKFPHDLQKAFEIGRKLNE
ncbi:MAG: NAD(P)H-dependent oxidoreductase [Eubacteriales bacterium]|nr:NAD(P)H-dependent oxidoreductase [Eubacteriales bacterium]